MTLLAETPKINVNQFEKIIKKKIENPEIFGYKEFNINMGNNSYYKVCFFNDNTCNLEKINKKSKKLLIERKKPEYILENIINIAVNSSLLNATDEK